MKPKEFYEKMKELSMNNDTEMMHMEMDDLLCECLESLGYKKGIEVFRDEPKWYA
jgi:hypothetical protein